MQQIPVAVIGSSLGSDASERQQGSNQGHLQAPGGSRDRYGCHCSADLGLPSLVCQSHSAALLTQPFFALIWMIMEGVPEDMLLNSPPEDNTARVQDGELLMRQDRCQHI